MFSGGILLWHGAIANIPTGYHLCDGTNGTPDLRNKFVVCANADVAGVAKTTMEGTAKQYGGAVTHVHPVDLESGAGNSPQDACGAPADFTAEDYAHTHHTTGNSNANDYFPAPYYALAYIMKL